jgi:hypothetical protein
MKLKIKSQMAYWVHLMKLGHCFNKKFTELNTVLKLTSKMNKLHTTICKFQLTSGAHREVIKQSLRQSGSVYFLVKCKYLAQMK